MESAWKMRYRITSHQPLEETIRGTERDSLNGQRKRHVWVGRCRSREILCPVYSSTRCSKRHWKVLWFAGKNQNALVQLWIWLLTNRRFADDVLLFSTSPAQLPKWCVSSNDAQRGREWRSTRKIRKLSPIKIRNIWREVAINNIKVDVLLVSECGKYLGQTKKIQQQETTESTGSACSTWWSLRRWAMLLEHGPWQKNTRGWSERLSAKCFDSIVQTKRKYKKKTQKRKDWK